MKTAGAALVLAGGWIVWRQYTRTLRREVAILEDFTAALTLLAGEIRWRRLPLPEGIRQMEERKLTGSYFRRVVKSMTGGNTLQDAWSSAFSDIPWEWGVLLRRMEWTGDAQQLQRSLLWTARQLDERRSVTREELHQREKLCAAVSASGAGLVILILM